MEEKNKIKVPEGTDHEDFALKTAAHYFADELLPYFGIAGKVVAIAPTESIHLEIKHVFQDFNLVMEDGSWKHFEFQSTNEGLEGLKRFRVYEALTSYQNKVSVTTYVLFSGTIRHPMTEFTEGNNTYRIIPIIMKDKDADKLIEELQGKIERGEEITRADLVPLTLCMLMGGKMLLKDRVKAAYEITQHASSVDSEDIRKVEAVLYIMADKFLDSMDMDEILEGISMTKLGQKLVDKGREEGEAKGKAEGIAEGEAKEKLKIAKSLIGVLDEKLIAERLGLPLETVQKLKEERS